MKLSKKFLCILLSAIMLFSMSVTAFAAPFGKQDCPVIFIPGYKSSEVYTDNDPEKVIDIPDNDTLLKIVEKKLIPALVTYSANGDADALALALSTEINIAFADWFNESTGDAKEGTGVDFNPAPTLVSPYSELTFHYDWRGDPLVIADELNAYINHILSISGCDKVALACHSFGSTVALSYLTEYGNDKVSSLVFDSPACDGVAIVGNLLTGKLTLDSATFAYFLEYSLGEEDYESLTASIVDLFNIAGIPELFTLFVDMIINELSPVLYKETFAPLFGYWPSMWAMVSDEYIDEAMAYIFDDLLKDKDLSALKARVSLYNSTVRKNKADTLKAFDTAGNFAVISRYGAPSFPLSKTSKLIGDTVIETRSTSLGAKTASVGTYFSDKALEGKDARYISPDKTVDASTCLFPEKTWFIKDITHAEMSPVEKYYKDFLFAEKELTCDTAELGRFSLYDRENDTIIKDETTPQKQEKVSFFTRITDFFKNLFARLSILIENLLKKK